MCHGRTPSYVPTRPKHDSYMTPLHSYSVTPNFVVIRAFFMGMNYIHINSLWKEKTRQKHDQDATILAPMMCYRVL
jgi:hypothetical protein